jgi:uncharacterized membrane protein
MLKNCKSSFLYSLGAGVYIVLVGLFMHYAESIFGKNDNVIGIVAVLILFSLSALVVGGLLIGKPIMLYVDGKKKEAVMFLVSTAGWLLLFFLITLLVLALR